jgi:hypothetical protein
MGDCDGFELHQQPKDHADKYMRALEAACAAEGVHQRIVAADGLG